MTKNNTQWITFHVYANTKYLLVCNGFIYPNNMKIYKNNARIKTISIMSNPISQTVELMDSPSPQVVVLDNPVQKEQMLKILVEDYYPGTIYNDAVISFISILGTNY